MRVLCAGDLVLYFIFLFSLNFVDMLGSVCITIAVIVNATLSAR